MYSTILFLYVNLCGLDYVLFSGMYIINNQTVQSSWLRSNIPVAMKVTSLQANKATVVSGKTVSCAVLIKVILDVEA